MGSRTVRNFGKIGDGIAVPDLMELQLKSYGRFLQRDVDQTKRELRGFEALLREVFPIISYDKKMELEFVG